MLIKCPDCKKKISTDVDRCPNCGCIIDAAKNTYEPAVVKGWCPLGVASAILTLLSPFIIMFFNAISLLITNVFHPTMNNTLAYIIILVMWNICPIALITLGSISLVKRKDAHTWPAIIGIVGGALEIFVFLIVTIGFFS